MLLRRVWFYTKAIQVQRALAHPRTRFSALPTFQPQPRRVFTTFGVTAAVNGIRKKMSDLWTPYARSSWVHIPRHGLVYEHDALPGRPLARVFFMLMELKLFTVQLLCCGVYAFHSLLIVRRHARSDYRHNSPKPVHDCMFRFTYPVRSDESYGQEAEWEVQHR